MSQYGTHPEYAKGLEDGIDEATNDAIRKFQPAINAARKVVDAKTLDDLLPAMRVLEAALIKLGKHHP